MSENANTNTAETAVKPTGRKGAEKKPAEKPLSLPQKLLAIQKAYFKG